MKHTTFENEKHIFSHALNGEHLVTATVLGKEVYVVSNGLQTDYPIPTDSHTIQWENPEFFSEGFKAAVHAWIISAQALGKLPSGVKYTGPAARGDETVPYMTKEELDQWWEYEDKCAARLTYDER